MKLKLEIGIGRLKFGLSESEVEELLGIPDKNIKDPDSDDSIIWIYNDEKIRLTFYKDEERRLGYMETSNPNLALDQFVIIDTNIDLVKQEFSINNITEWEIEDYHSFTSYFNEDFWLTLHVEYGRVTSIQLGVPFINEEEYKWPNL